MERKGFEKFVFLAILGFIFSDCGFLASMVNCKPNLNYYYENY
jgi:hypothetical protein